MESMIIDDLKKDILKYCKNFGSTKTIENFEKDILNLNIPELSCFFALNVIGTNLPEHFRVIYNSNDYYSLYHFCKKFNEELNININEIAKIIAEKGGVELNYTFINDFSRHTTKKNINIDYNVKSIIDGNNYKYIVDILSSFCKKELDKHLNVHNVNCGYLLVNLSEDDIDTIGEKFLRSDDLFYSYVYAILLQSDRDVSKHLEKILESKDPKYNYLAYKNIANSPKNKHMDVIIKSNSSKVIMSVLREINGIDKKRYVQVIMENGNPEALYSLLNNYRWYGIKLKQSDMIHIFEKIYESGDIEYNYKLIMNYCSMINIKKHAEVIINSDNVDYIFQILVKYPDKIDTNKALDAISESNNPEYNFKVANRFSDNERNIKSIIESGSAKYCYKTALEIKNDYMKELENAVIESGDVEYNYRYALNIADCDLKAHLAVIIESRNPEYNYLAIQNIEGADIEAHMNAILESGDIDYIDKYEEIEYVKNQSIANKIKRIENLRVM